MTRTGRGVFFDGAPMRSMKGWDPVPTKSTARPDGKAEANAFRGLMFLPIAVIVLILIFWATLL